MQLNLNAWLQVAAACWLWRTFAPSVDFIPSSVNGYIAVVGGLACLLVIASEVWPILKGVFDSVWAKRGKG